MLKGCSALDERVLQFLTTAGSVCVCVCQKCAFGVGLGVLSQGMASPRRVGGLWCLVGLWFVGPTCHHLAWSGSLACSAAMFSQGQPIRLPVEKLWHSPLIKGGLPSPLLKEVLLPPLLKGEDAHPQQQRKAYWIRHSQQS